MPKDRQTDGELKVGWCLIPPYVITRNDLSSSDKLVFGRINGLLTGKGYCYASNEWLGKQIGLSKKTVSNIITKLRLKKLIIVKIKRDDKRQIVQRHIFVPGFPNEGIGIPERVDRGIPVKGEESVENKSVDISIPVSVETGSKCPNKEEGHKGCLEFIKSFAESRNVKFANYGKQINAIHKLIRSGYKWEEINKQIDRMEKDRFWILHGFDLMSVANEIGKRGVYGNKN